MSLMLQQTRRIAVDPRFQILFLMAVTLAMLVPFLPKAYTIDDPVFMRVGQHIVEDPFNPYGFSMNWEFTKTPVYIINNNPPLLSYFLALTSVWTHWQELRVHTVMLVFSCGAIGGMYLLGRLWMGSGILPALLLLASPFFSVSASTVMTDVPMVALYIWALALWELGIQQRKWHWLALGAVAVSLAFLTKYFGITALPLMVLMCLFRKQAMPFWWVPLLIPVVVVGLYEASTGYLYGSGQLTSAWFDTGSIRESVSSDNFQYRFATGATFIGASCVAAALLVPLLWKKQVALFWGITFLEGAILGAIFLDGFGSATFGGDDWPAWPSGLQFGIWAVAGAHLIAVVIAEMYSRRDRTTLILAAWFWGAIIFGIALNWSITARVLLPAAAAAALIVARRLHAQSRVDEIPWGKRVLITAIVASGAIAFVVTWADTLWTYSVVRASDRIIKTAAPTAPIYFQGHWGLHWYLEERGAESADTEMAYPMQFNMVWPSNSTHNHIPNKEFVVGSAHIKERGSSWVSTCSRSSGAGFYSNRIGPLPFVFGKIPYDEYWIFLYDRQALPSAWVDFPTTEKSGL